MVSQWNDDVTIETPEQIDLSLEVAGVGSRFLARLLDWGVEWGLLLIIAFLAAIVIGLLGVSPEKVDSAARMVLLAIVVGLFYLFFLAYDIYFEVRHNGQTPGKLRAGIRVVRENGAPVDFQTSCIRNLLALADFLPAFYFLGAFLIQWTTRHQRLGDMAAGTLVIRERVVQVPPDLSEEIGQSASADVSFTAEQLAACLPEGEFILRSYFQRRQDLDKPARWQLARRLAEQFVQKTNYPLATPMQNGAEAERLLASLYRDLLRLKQHGR